MVQGAAQGSVQQASMLQQLNNLIVVRVKRDLVQGSAAPRSQSWQSKFSPEILVCQYTLRIRIRSLRCHTLREEHRDCQSLQKHARAAKDSNCTR